MLRALLLLAASIAATLTAPSAATAAVERIQGTPFENPSGLLTVSPFRIEQDVQPGVRTIVRMSLVNESDQPLDASLTSTDLGASSNPRSVAAKVEDGEFGAGDWLKPEQTDFRLKPWEQVLFDLVIDPPLDAPVGTNLAGLAVDTTIATGKPGTGDFEGGAYRVEALIQAFLTVPGPVEHDLRILDVDVRDSLVLGSQRFVVWDVTFQNNGTVNEHVNGSVDVVSLFGNTVKRERFKEYIVLRGAKRTARVVWRDLPWVGAFTPEVRVRGDDAKLQTATGERVIVLPWWLPLLIAATLVLPPLLIWWRRRREWRLYMDDEDGDWNEEWSDADSPEESAT